MDWLQLLALLGGGTGVAFLVRQILAFAKFVLARKAIVDVAKTPGSTERRVIIMAKAMRMIDPKLDGRTGSDPDEVTKGPSEPSKPRLLPDSQDDERGKADDPAAGGKTA